MWQRELRRYRNDSMHYKYVGQGNLPFFFFSLGGGSPQPGPAPRPAPRSPRHLPRRSPGGHLRIPPALPPPPPQGSVRRPPPPSAGPARAHLPAPGSGPCGAAGAPPTRRGSRRPPPPPPRGCGTPCRPSGCRSRAGTWGWSPARRRRAARSRRCPPGTAQRRTWCGGGRGGRAGPALPALLLFLKIRLCARLSSPGRAASRAAPAPGRHEQSSAERREPGWGVGGRGPRCRRGHSGCGPPASASGLPRPPQRRAGDAAPLPPGSCAPKSSRCRARPEAGLFLLCGGTQGRDSTLSSGGEESRWVTGRRHRRTAPIGSIAAHSEHALLCEGLQCDAAALWGLELSMGHQWYRPVAAAGRTQRFPAIPHVKMFYARVWKQSWEAMPFVIAQIPKLLETTLILSVDVLSFLYRNNNNNNAPAPVSYFFPRCPVLRSALPN